MKTHLLRNIFIVGSAALALAASTVVLPSVADARPGFTYQTHGMIHSYGQVGANYHRYRGYGGYGGAGYYGGYYGGYYPYCTPLQLALGLCGPWGY
jgi:hypothetical protein